MQSPRIPREPGPRRLPAAAPGSATFGPHKPTAHPPGPATCNPRVPGFAALRRHRPPGPGATALALSRARSS